MNSTRVFILGLCLAVALIGVMLLIPKPRSFEVLSILLFGIAGAYGGYVLADPRKREVVIELLNIFGLMAALILLGIWVAPVWLAIGYFAHGLWDILHHSKVRVIKTYVPDWYTAGCLIFDWIIGAFILLRF